MERPLSGIRIIALEQYMAGPYCSLLLADAGAEVIKIERPGIGDPRRSIPPFAEKNGIKKAGGFMSYNRNKKSVCLDIKTDEGKAIYHDLIKVSDVVVENMRPGLTDKLKIGYNVLKKINPKLIYAAISGFGRLDELKGPDSDRPAFDIVAEAMSGIMHLVGFGDKPPSWTIYGMADIYTGLCTSFAITQSLLYRERTGKGQFVDSSMLDSMLSLNERMIMLYSITGKEPLRGRLEHLYPRGAFKCKDGYIALNIPDDRIWERFCSIIQRPDLISDDRTATGNARAKYANFLEKIINDWLLKKTRSEAEAIFNKNGVPAGPVNSAKDIFSSEQVKARKSIIEIDDPEVGNHKFARGPVVLSDCPEVETSPAPSLGQHTNEILSNLLEYSEERIKGLLDSKIIGVPKER